MHRELVNRGYNVNHKRVQRLMHNMKLLGKRPKEKYHSYKGEVGKIADNIIDRDFSTTAPLQKWTTDVSQFSFSWGKCYLSPILDMNTRFELIKHFGFQSGKDVNKFDSFKEYKLAENQIPYITKNTNAYLSCKVVSKFDVGSHITFVADVTSDVVLNNTETLTYSYYLNNIKPKPEKTKNENIEEIEKASENIKSFLKQIKLN